MNPSMQKHLFVIATPWYRVKNVLFTLITEQICLVILSKQNKMNKKKKNHRRFRIIFAFSSMDNDDRSEYSNAKRLGKQAKGKGSN